MRVLVDIPDDQLSDLRVICAARKLSRAEVVRQAIAAYIVQNRPSREAAFGLWKGRAISLPDDAGSPELMPEDGLAYQERLRSEW